MIFLSFFYSNELAHHGVLGMKWGVRRYQPYPKGKKPKGAKEVGEAKKVEKKTKIVSTEEATRAKVKSMSDDELRAEINRLELEKRYRTLMNEGVKNVESSTINSGKKAIAKFSKEIIESSIKDVVKFSIAAGLKKVIK